MAMAGTSSKTARRIRAGSTRPSVDRRTVMAKKKDPFDSYEFQSWAADMRKRLIPKMRGSENVLMLAPDVKAEFDISFALQIGACILLEKPLILVVHPGRQIPPKLRAI